MTADVMQSPQLASLRFGGTLGAAQTPKGSREEQIEAVSRQFVGFFYGYMLKTMRSSVHQSEIGHGGGGERMFQELWDEEVGNEIARGDRSGLADLIADSLLRRTGGAADIRDTANRQAARAAYGRNGQ